MDKSFKDEKEKPTSWHAGDENSKSGSGSYEDYSSDGDGSDGEQGTGLSFADFGYDDLSVLNLGDYQVEKKETKEEKAAREKAEQAERAILIDKELKERLAKRGPKDTWDNAWAANGEAEDRRLFQTGHQVLNHNQSQVAHGYAQRTGAHHQQPLGPEVGPRMYKNFRNWVDAGRGFDPETPQNTQLAQVNNAEERMSERGISLDCAPESSSNVVGPAAQLLADFADTVPQAMKRSEHLRTLELGHAKKGIETPHSGQYSHERLVQLHDSALAQTKDKFLQLAVHELGHAYFEEVFAKTTLSAKLQGELAAAFATIRDGEALVGIDGAIVGGIEDRKVYQKTNGAFNLVEDLERAGAKEKAATEKPEPEKEKAKETEVVTTTEVQKREPVEGEGCGSKAEKKNRKAVTTEEKPPHILDSASEFLAETFMAYLLHRQTLITHVQTFSRIPTVFGAWQTVLEILGRAIESDASNLFMQNLLASMK